MNLCFNLGEQDALGLRIFLGNSGLARLRNCQYKQLPRLFEILAFWCLSLNLIEHFSKFACDPG